MGKDLKHRELGQGLSQRKDGRFSARYVQASGKRIEKYFATLKEAKLWLDDRRYEERHGVQLVHAESEEKAQSESADQSSMTVDMWFTQWHDSIIFDLRPNTRRNYRERYERNIQPVIGKMKITEVKPMHCKKVLKLMDSEYAGSTIRQTYITMGTMFRAALMNDIITKHPMDGVRYSKPIRAANDIHFLTVEEQRIFLETGKDSHNYFQYALILETGLRTGELIGLTWDSIDWKKRTLSVTKTLEFRHNQKHWRAGPPKTLSSYRTIPLTEKAYTILKRLYDNRFARKESELLEQTLEYIDRKTGKTVKFKMHDLVFVNYRTGEPSKNSSYDTHLYKLCDKAGIEHFCMHALRHTFATRMIEAGVQPKSLQRILGHSSIKTTMDRYVHVTSDSLNNAMELFERSSNTH